MFYRKGAVDMNRQKIAFLAMVAMAPFLLAMGILGDPPRLDRAPEPKMRLDAIILDSEGTTTQISHISYEGELYLPVYRGKALVTIPFQKISRLVFGPKKNSTRQVRIVFTDRSEEEFFMNEKVLFVGKLPFGTYQIQAKDVGSITLIQPDSDSAHPGAPANGDAQSS
jgi:hypothetical protein